MGNVNLYNRSQYKDFWMGPSIRLVHFQKKKIMGKFFSCKKDQTRGGGGGGEGGLAKDHTFSVFFLCTLPLVGSDSKLEPTKKQILEVM